MTHRAASRPKSGKLSTIYPGFLMLENEVVVADRFEPRYTFPGKAMPDCTIDDLNCAFRNRHAIAEKGLDAYLNAL